MRKLCYMLLGMALPVGLSFTHQGAEAYSPPEFVRPYTPAEFVRPCQRVGEDVYVEVATPKSEEQCNARFQQWVMSMQPADRHRFLSQLLLEVDPSHANNLAFMPADRIEASHHAQRFAEVCAMMTNAAVAPTAPPADQRKRVAGTFELLDVGRPPMFVSIFAHQPTMPESVWSDAPLVDACLELQRKEEATRLLRQGESLGREGQFNEALNCFKLVHLLYPGTNLEARAGAASQDLLVKLYGTDTEKGLYEELCDEQAHSVCQAGACPFCKPAKAIVPASASNLQTAKPTTTVYFVGDLLGKGKARLDDLDNLLHVMTSVIEPNSWNENGGPGAIDFYYRTRSVVVTQTPNVHEKIATLLADLRHAQPKSEEAEVAKEACKEAHCAECVAPAGFVYFGGYRVEVKERCTEVDAPEHWKPTGCCEECCETALEETVSAPAVHGLWHLPIGPLTFRLELENHKLLVGVGFGESTSTEENCDEEP